MLQSESILQHVVKRQEFSHSNTCQHLAYDAENGVLVIFYVQKKCLTQQTLCEPICGV